MTKMYQLFPHLVDDPSTPVASESLFDSTVGVGVELEAEGMIPPDESTYWLFKEDGSLRTDFRTECIFKRALRGVDIKQALEEIEPLFQASPRLTRSWRNSTHVHIDVRDLTQEEYQRVALPSLMLEPYLFWCSSTGRGRSTNYNCRPVHMCPQSADVWVKQLCERPHRAINPRERYLAVNPLSLGVLGSIEYRMSGALYSAKEVLRWVNMLLELRMWAKKTSHQSPTLLLFQFSELGAEAFTRLYLPTTFDGWEDSLAVTMQAAMGVVQDIVLRLKVPNEAQQLHFGLDNLRVEEEEDW